MLIVLTTIHVLAAVAIIALVLMQQGKGADAGAAFGAGGSATVFGARGAASFLTRATAVLAVLFFLSSLGLARMATQQVAQPGLVERVTPTAPATPPTTAAPQAEDVPAATPGSGAGDSDVPAPSGDGTPPTSQ